MTTQIGQLIPLTIQVAPSAGQVGPSAISSGQWVDISTYAENVTWSRGTDHWTNQPNAGQATFTMNNLGGQLTPWSSGAVWGSYGYGYCPIRIRATYAGTTYNLFFGYIADVQPSYSTKDWRHANIIAYDWLQTATTSYMPPSWLHYATMQSSPIAYYKMLESGYSLVGSSLTAATAVDSSGNGNNGTYSNVQGLDVRPAQHGTGASDPGYQLCASGMVLSPNVNATLASTAFTASCVFNTNATMVAPAIYNTATGVATPANAIIMGHQNTSSGWVISANFSTSWNLNVTYINTSGTVYTIQTSYPTFGFVPGLEYMLDLVRNGSTLTLYVNGVSVGSTSVSGTCAVNPVSIGGSGGVGTANTWVQLDGAVGEVAVYNSALSSGTIQSRVNFFNQVQRTTNSWAQLAATAVGVSTSDLNFETGLSTLVEPDASAGDVRSYLQQIATDEQGLLFVDGSGKLTFYNHQHTIKSPNNIPVANFGNAGSSPLPVEELKPSGSVLDYFNQVQLQRASGQPIYYPATVSGAVHTYRFPNQLNLSTDIELTALAQKLIKQYDKTSIRFEGVKFSPGADPAYAATYWPVALGAELWNTYTANWQGQDSSGATLSATVLLEKMTHTVDFINAKWVADFVFAQADTTNYWTVGDATYGAICSNPIAY